MTRLLRRSLLGVALILTSCVQPEEPELEGDVSALESPRAAQVPPPIGPAGSWTFVWGDEFSGTELDTTLWTTNYPYNRSPQHGELEAYSPTAVTVANGFLRLTATRQPLNGQPYTSGIVTSAGHFSWQYGVAEIRLQTPAGVGYWPAFWTMNIPFGSFPPEIDMLELKGGQPSTLWMGHYWGTWPTVFGFQKTWTGANFTTGFHTVTVEWQPTHLIWYVDGVRRAATRKNVPQTAMYLIANLAVGGTFAGNPTPATVFPGVMQVDYIRVWQ
jgi:beta-glucanase (GH16 family)